MEDNVRVSRRLAYMIADVFLIFWFVALTAGFRAGACRKPAIEAAKRLA